MTWAEMLRRLEDTWSPDGNTFLLPKSVGASALKDGAVGASALKDGAVGPAAIARFRPQWVGFSFHRFWTPYEDPNFAPAYVRSPLGYVDIRGLVSKPGVAWTAFDPMVQLPAGFRPRTARIFPAMIAAGAGFGVARVTVYPDGNVVFGGMYAGTASSWDPRNWVSLDAIGFWAEG